jgi:hypothetical protein
MSNQIRIPAESFRAMRRSLYHELGPEAAGRALQEAGYAAGDSLFERLMSGEVSDLRDTPSASFWDRLAQLFDELGWGSVRHEEVHAGVGALVATHWFEADPEASGASCPFTTGVLANLLGRVAGEDVAVMQVPCRGDASPCARFVFGSASALDGLYSGLREGRDLDAALAALG